MALIESISGIRGTIGGKPGDGLCPPDIVRFAAAFAEFIRNRSGNRKITVVVGRDARTSGDMVHRLVTGTLLGMGADVVDAGLSTTPTVEMAVTDCRADGGIIITASHNPEQWNALKLLHEQGEFLNDEEGRAVLALSEAGNFDFATHKNLGTYRVDDTFIEKHIRSILALPLVDIRAIRKAGFRVVVDCVNSTGALAIPRLLKALNVADVIELFCEPTGRFPHNPEPLPENLGELSATVVKKEAHVGFAVDPDVDRLAIVNENGDMFGEEYTLVAVADYVLGHQQGNTVSNLSSTRALRDITLKAGGAYFASAVGEVNVVETMKKHQAVIGGEGNGGIIYPALHYGRDALAGIALFLSSLARSGKSCSMLRKNFPDYYISKNKIELPAALKLDDILVQIGEKYAQYPRNTLDGIRIEFGQEWVHLRKSNTEPIIRIYSESDSLRKADHLARKIIEDLREIIRQQQNGF